MSDLAISHGDFAEGLDRLSGNVNRIDFHRSEWQLAFYVNRKRLTPEAMQELPELIAWRQFCGDIIAELKAACEISSRQFSQELPSCYALAIAMETGKDRDNPQLQLTAIVELDMMAARLRSGTVEPVSKKLPHREKVQSAEGDETNPWISICMDHIKRNKSTLSRHSKDPIKYGIRCVGHGDYQVRRSRLVYYIATSFLSKYGQET